MRDPSSEQTWKQLLGRLSIPASGSAQHLPAKRSRFTVDWFSEDPKQCLINFRHCQRNHFSWRNVPSCYEISWKPLFKLSLQTAVQRDLHWELVTEFPFPGAPGSQEATAQAGREQRGRGSGFWINAYRLEKDFICPGLLHYPF